MNGEPRQSIHARGHQLMRNGYFGTLRSKPEASRLKYFSRRRGMIDSVSFQFCPIATYPNIHKAGLRRVREQGREAFAHACRQCR